jgi:hypothetical protein
VWRVENPRLWKEYASQRESVAVSLKQLQIKYNLPSRRCTTDLEPKLESFCDITTESLQNAVNEVFLLHGTKPEVLLTILSNGLSDKFSGGLFGEGIYLAETPTKNDQYTTIDDYSSGSASKDVAALHQHLYRSSAQPGGVYYLLLCKVVMGYYDRTKDGMSSLDHGGSLWAPGAQAKELSKIEDTVPPIHYHALIAETGRTIQRHREFLQYHHARVYPAYVLAYQRMLDGVYI